MKSIKNYFLVFFLILIAQSSFSQTISNESLDVLSWNLYMLPGITNLSKEIHKSNKKERAKEIADYLNNTAYDVVVFQEAFFHPSRKVLAKGIKEKYPYQYGPINPSKASLKTSSGIFVVSKTPLKLLGAVKYKSCNGVDCFAKKGAALLEGEFNGKTFQILGTHLNAGGPHWIHQEQYKYMSQLLNDFKKLNVPQIVCGDMNTHKEETFNYENMLNMLDCEDIETNSKQVFTTAKDRSVIDYIMLRKNNSSIKAINKEILWLKSKAPVIEKLNGNLSDHLAVTASFIFE